MKEPDQTRASIPPRAITRRGGLVDGDVADQQVVQDTVGSLPGRWTLSIHSTAAEALRDIPPCPPEVVLVEAELPDMPGVECARRLKALLPALPLIMLGSRHDPHVVFSAFLAGASFYLFKPIPCRELGAAVLGVAAGEHPALSTEVGYALIDRIQHAAAGEFAKGLTPREHQVMGLLLSGRSDKEIASRLGTAPATVHAHKAHLFRKLGAHGSAEAVRKFLGANEELRTPSYTI